ncbi:VWA domain-containing protein [Thalassomonas viridans]|uniref:VWA domain-containing protein n=1 Tax=Thalassomonas viridans TaxID=137584 RepID=A0AAF0CAG8_9GAMM|nr:VWA domain-containing protein [Thalassomonas viridans]WDE05849.1 VWA domain-containing protein [Thalassomonas viridans]
MTEKRKEDGFNLAFLDVMACGLGAVLMILILVKFNANSAIPTDELEKLQQELAAMEDKKSETEQSLDTVNDAIAMESSTIEALKQRIEELKIQQDETRRALNDKVAVVANLEKSIAAAAPKTADDPIQVAGSGEENYLLGLKVEGKHIGILIDKSASMTEEALVDVIKRKIGNQALRKSGPKWQRTVRVAKWLFARLPQEAKVSVVTFNDTAATLGPRAIYTAKLSQNLKTLVAEVDSISPGNGTNLQAGLNAIKKAMPNMTDLYVITDGLPTLGEQSRGLRSFAQCGSFFGRATTISGECRVKLFEHTLKISAPKDVRTNIILLPLEGDPHAAQAYWTWAASTGGLFISPASTWP